MFSRIRFYAGLASLVVFITYFVISITSNLAATPAQEIDATVRFYEDAAASWSQILTVFFSMIWIVGTPLHGGLLMRKRTPQRIAAIAAIGGFGGMMLFAVISAVQDTPGPTSGSQTPDWAFWLVTLVPLTVQVLDLVLPPWPRVLQKAPMVIDWRK